MKKKKVMPKALKKEKTRVCSLFELTNILIDYNLGTLSEKIAQYLNLCYRKEKQFCSIYSPMMWVAMDLKSCCSLDRDHVRIFFL